MEFSPAGHLAGDTHDAQESMFGHSEEFPVDGAEEEPDELLAEEQDEYGDPPLGDEREWARREEPHAAIAADSHGAGVTTAEAHSTTEAVRMAASGPMTMGDFAALEERVLRAVNLVRRERQARLASDQRAEVLEGRVLALEAELQLSQATTGQLEQLQREIEALRAERENVRQRVERLLGQLDALEL